MKLQILAALALSLSLGTSALAQTATQSDTSAQAGAAAQAGGMPADWDSDVSDAFFSDADAGTLRSEDEVRAGWDDLSAEQQASVRAHCATVDLAGDMDAGGADIGETDDQAAGGATTDTQAGMTDDDADGADVAADLRGDDSAEADLADTQAGMANDDMDGSDAAADLRTEDDAADTADLLDEDDAGVDGEATASIDGDVHQASIAELCGMIEDR